MSHAINAERYAAKQINSPARIMAAEERFCLAAQRFFVAQVLPCALKMLPKTLLQNETTVGFLGTSLLKLSKQICDVIARQTRWSLWERTSLR